MRTTRHPAGRPARYLVLLEPELVPLPLEPLLPAPVVLSVLVLPLAPLLGMPEVPAAPPVVLLAPAPAPVSDLKWSSHSEREIWPSLFLSTSEKFGAWVLAPAPAEAPPVAPVAPVVLVSLAVLPEAPVLPAAPVVALGVWVSALDPDAPDDPAAWTAPAIASSAALVATPISLSLNICASSKVKGCGPCSMQSPCRVRRQTGMFWSGNSCEGAYR